MKINFRKSLKSYFDFDMNSVKGYWTSQNFEPMPKKEEHFSEEYVETPLVFVLVLATWIFLLHKRDCSFIEHLQVCKCNP